jgi:hypothetical protein
MSERAAVQQGLAETISGSRQSPRTSKEINLAVTRAIVGVAAVIGLLSPGQPTGSAIYDAFYRAGFVALLAWSASRSRRWSLIIASAIAAVGSLGIALLAGASALAIVVWLASRNTRDRRAGALCGALIGFSLLRMSTGWFEGSSALLAALAACPVLWSAYSLQRSNTRRYLRIAAFAILGLFGLGACLAGAQALRFRSPLQEAVAETTAGINAGSRGDTTDASNRLLEASRQFTEVAEESRAWFYAPARAVPGLSHNLRSVDILAESGARLTSTAASATTSIDYDRLRQEGGGINLSALNELGPPVRKVADELEQVTAEVASLDSPWIIPLLAEKVQEFEDKTSGFTSQAQLASIAVSDAPAVLGAQGSRRYLFLLGSPSELRDLGGHIGNYAVLSFEDGRMTLEEVGSPLDLAQPELEASLAEENAFPLSVLALRPASFPQNWGASLDFQTDATLAASLYSSKTGKPLDGVAYADPEVLAALLAITGPRPLPLLKTTIDAGNAVEFLTLGQYTAYDQQTTGQGALEDLTKDIFQTFTATTLPGPKRLADLFSPLVSTGRLRFISIHPEDERLLNRLRANRPVAAVRGADFLAVTNRNANPSKIDRFLRRTVSYSATWDPATGEVSSTASVILQNEAPTSGLPAYVIGNQQGEPDGSNVTDVAVLSPFELSEVTINGEQVATNSQRELGYWRHEARAVIPPGGTLTLKYHLKGQVAVGDLYRLDVVKQPTLIPESTQISLTARDSDLEPGDGVTVAENVATITLSENQHSTIALRAI